MTLVIISYHILLFITITAMNNCTTFNSICTMYWVHSNVKETRVFTFLRHIFHFLLTLWETAAHSQMDEVLATNWSVFDAIYRALCLLFCWWLRLLFYQFFLKILSILYIRTIRLGNDTESFITFFMLIISFEDIVFYLKKFILIVCMSFLWLLTI